MPDVKKVLVVDDEPDLRDIIQLRVESLKHEVMTAGNGMEALAKARSETPDLIVTDILMPMMDGEVFYNELKKDPGLRHIPVIILTARGNIEEAFKVLAPDSFLAKPFEGQDLMDMVTRLLASRDTRH